MTNQPSGRDLDRAVAEAMGWTYVEAWFAEGLGSLHGVHPTAQERRRIQNYSTDFSALPEMLKWLEPFGPLMLFRDENGPWTADWCDAQSFGGTTASELPFAVAKFVVEVASRRSK